ncbi:MAG TPA: D-alanyl-D-alanine dipeptidase [Peptococcaceae bacterium]|nr:D-alanyl-D-alanine dipeptidase [Peptococcaceae bacterium]
MPQDSHMAFDKIQHWIPDAIIDLKYSTDDNFTGKAIYECQYDRLRAGTLVKLKHAADLLRPKGYRLVIWDAYRPIEVQKVLWQTVSDPDFVAPPEIGSKHNRGCAVDVTLADLQGNYLVMPSPFDDFSEAASAILEGLEEPVYTHLKGLQEAMLSSGFEIYLKEWWHFTDSDWETYELV